MLFLMLQPRLGGEAVGSHHGAALDPDVDVPDRPGPVYGGGLQPGHERPLCQAPPTGSPGRHSRLPVPHQPER